MNTKLKRNINIIGNKYHRLTAIKFYERRGRFDYWVFRCECSNFVIYRKNNVTSAKGKTKSCGCLNRENTINTGKKNRTHGMSTDRFYFVFKTLRNRCNNPKSEKYYLYGGRGIRCLWDSFEEFKHDMYESYVNHLEEYGRDTSIDRMDVNGDYCKSNCRWATAVEQANNKQRHVTK